VERIAYRRAPRVIPAGPLITAIGMSIVLQNFVQITQGARNKPLQPIITGRSSPAGRLDGTGHHRGADLQHADRPSSSPR
jgi:branched-chain amino acid transport system permease protein